jgi:hypothetical protein
MGLKCNRLLFAAISLILFTSHSVAVLHDEPGDHDMEKTFKVDKNGIVTIGVDISAGDVIIKKGKYSLFHAVQGELHFVTLTPRTMDKATAPSAAIQLDSRLLASREAISRSVLVAAEQADHTYGLVSIQIAGENGEHVSIRASHTHGRTQGSTRAH